jgi:hypothetical protein
MLLILLGVASAWQSNAQGLSDSLASQRSTNMGSLRILTNLDTLFMVVDSNFAAAIPVRDSALVELSEGIHDVVLLHRQIEDFKSKVRILPDSIRDYKAIFKRLSRTQEDFSRSGYPRVIHNANLLILTDDESKIFVDSLYVGTGMLKSMLPKGVHRIMTESEKAGTTNREVTVSDAYLAVREMYNRVPAFTYGFGSAIPGGGQYFKNQYLKSGLLFCVTTGLWATSYMNHRQYVSDNDEYLRLREEYTKAATETDAMRLGTMVQSQYDRSRRTARNRIWLLLAGSAVYLYSVLDAIISPPDVFRVKKKYDLIGDILVEPAGAQMNLRVPINQ